MSECKKAILISVVINLFVLVIFFNLFVPAVPLTENKKEDPVKSSEIMHGLSDQESRVVEVVSKANPAVVSVVVTRDVPIMDRWNIRDPFFGDFFGIYEEPRTERREVGGGSGFLVSADGLIVTNRHVVSLEEAEYSVLTNDGENYEAEVIARDPVLDIAILKISGNEFSHLTFGKSEDLQVGQTVIAIGNALGEFRNTVSSGIVSGLSRSIIAGGVGGQMEFLEEVIQTDAAINRGNSGGPLIDLSGQVVGVNVAVAQGGQNIGFALPSEVVKSVVESVREHGEIIRPFLGVRYLNVNEQIQKEFDLPRSSGAYVTSNNPEKEPAVLSGSPAEKSGIREGDLIVSIAGEEIGSNKSLATIIRRQKVGDAVPVVLVRDGREITLEAVLVQAP